jgi:tetratricopeptide (TPR) repeat protein
MCTAGKPLSVRLRACEMKARVNQRRVFGGASVFADLLEMYFILYMIHAFNQQTNTNHCLNTLNNELPNRTQKTHLLTQIGCMHAQREEPVLAQVAFQRVRAANPSSMTSMDVYAGIMRGLGHSAALNALTRDLVNTDSKRPEAWMAMALLCDMREEKPKALKYVERALELDPNHLLASQFQGILNLAAGRPEVAVANFYRVSERG